MFAPHLQLNKSRLLAVILVFIHLLAITSLFLADLHPWFFLVISGLCVVSCYYQVKLHAWRTAARSIIKLDYQYDEWHLQLRTGQRYCVRLCGHSIIHPWLTILNFQLSANNYALQRIYSVIILPGTLSNSEFRRLRKQLAHF